MGARTATVHGAGGANESHDRRGISRRFSRAAAHYDRLTDVQRLVAERLDSLLEPPTTPERILEIGCGTGCFTHLVRRRFPTSRLWAIDFAEGMIRRAREAVPDKGITWIVADARQVLPPLTFDLIVSSSSLHWMLPLDRLFNRIRDRLAPGGRLIFSLMCAGSLRELRECRRRVAPHKEPRGHLASKAEVAAALNGAGLGIEKMEEQTIEQRHRDAASLLETIHRQGVTGGVFSPGVFPLTRGEIRSLIADYDTHCPHPGGGVRATYEVLHVHARRSA